MIVTITFFLFIIQKFDQLKKYNQTAKNSADNEDDFQETLEELKSIQGVLVNYPLEFLKGEWFHPDESWRDFFKGDFKGNPKDLINSPVAWLGTFQ